MKRLLLFCAVALLAAVGAAAAADRIDPLPQEQAFRFSAHWQDGEAVVVYEMIDGVYLYRDKLLLTTATPGVNVGDFHLPDGMLHEDPFFGKTTVYYGGLTLRAAVAGDGEFELAAYSQGCDEQVGICYPPQKDTALLAIGDAVASHTGGNNSGENDEASSLSSTIADGNLLWTAVVFFLLGVGLSLTPCVLPMLPILMGILGAAGTRRRMFLLTAVYIGAIVVSYTAMGIAAGASGQLLATVLQQPLVLAGSALLFVFLALSMFGLYELQPPAAARAALAKIGGGGIVGTALLGVLSAVVVSPCVAPPLIGALLYIASTGDMFTGGIALMSLSLGMSVLLAVAGIAGAGVLPRVGEWMNGVKQLFGLLLLFLAVWVASPLLPVVVQMLLFGVLLLFGGVLAKPFAMPTGSLAAATKAIALAAMLWGAMLLAGAALGGRDVLTPLSPLTGGSGVFANKSTSTAAAEVAPVFRPVATVADLRQELAETNRPVVLEYFADWCVSCKEMERFTFADARVRARLQQASLLRADVTDNNDANRALLEEYGLFGPPAILFFDADGEMIGGVRVTGYQSADKFLRTLAAAGL